MATRKLSKRQQAEIALEKAREARREKLVPLYQAIREGRAYLDTAFGRHIVKGYNDETGNCVTVPVSNPDAWLHQRTFMVCYDAIRISK
jgi:hypothetical protein